MADFTGTDGIDVLLGTDDNDNLYGLGGADFLKGLFGDDYIDGGDGNDRATYYLTNPSFGGVTVSLLLQGQPQDTGAQGWDTLVNIENLSGTPFSDILTGDDNANWLWGSPATLGDGSISSLNNDFLYGMGGNDLLVVGIGNHTIDGGDDNDTLRFTENGAQEGGVFINLQLQGQQQDTGQGLWTITNIENLSGGTVDDVLGGNFSANVLAGDSGNDSLNGRGGDDILYGDGRIATNVDGVITTYADVAELGGVDGNDAIQGGSGNDSLYGGGGSDVLNGGFDNDLVDGGDGNDRAGFYQSDPNLGGVHVSLMLQDQAQDTGQGMDTLTGIEDLSGTPFSDTLTGDGGDNWLWGSAATIGPGNISADNNDFLYGLGGNDLLTVGIGNHTVDGGDDNDTLQFGENGAPESGITVNLNQQDGTAQNTGQGNWILLGIENVSSGVANDTLIGDGNANVLAGSSGDDMLNGGGGADTLYGDGRIATNFDQVITTTPDVGTLGDPALTGNGNDTLRGGGGDDQLYGGGGDDYMRGDDGNDTIDGGSGTDLVGYLFNDLTSGVNFDASSFGSAPSVTMSDGRGGTDTLSNVEQLGISGSNFDDVLIGSEFTISTTGFANMIDGNGGNDEIYASGHHDQINGGDGDDYVEAKGGDDYVTGGNGNDILWGENGVDHVDGGDGNDFLFGGYIGSSLPQPGDDADFLTGGLGNDVIRGGDGDDLLDGGDGDDNLRGDNGNDTIAGGAGVDFVSYRFDDTGITAGVTFDASNFASAASFTMSDGRGGTDTLSDVEALGITGSAFDDVLIGSQFATITAGGFANQISGNGGNDQITGGASVDFLDGGAGNDVLNGGGGDDFLVSGRGVDTINGGAGYDALTVDYSALTSAVKMVAPSPSGNGSISGGKADTATFQGIESFSITTGAGADSVATGNGNDVVSTGVGADTVNSGGGDDNVSTGDGNDNIQFLASFNGADVVDGGAGTDTLSLSGGASVALNNVAGIELLSLATGGAYNLTTVDANVASGAVLTVSASGLKAAEALNFDGSAESDGRFTITSGAGADALKGGALADTIIAGAGNDLIAGGRGDDVMTGGNGVDTFAIGSSSGHDRVTDFTASSDKIAFGTASGVASFSQLVITQVGKDTLISWGSPGNDITLTGVKAGSVNASQFQFGASPAAALEQSALTLQSTSSGDDHGHHATFTNFANDHLFG